MSTKKLGFTALLLGFVGACATPTGPGFGAGGDDGLGGEGGNGGASTGNGGALMTSSSSSSSSGSSSGGSSSSSSSGSASSSASSSSSGGPVCNAPDHLCSGVCTGNTPASGCFTSQVCSACAPVQNGSPMCTPQGFCDVSCNAGYQKNGYACICSSMCCSDANCPAGQTCSGGVCKAPPCDPAACTASCIFQGKIGTCIAGMCICVSP